MPMTDPVFVALVVAALASATLSGLAGAGGGTILIGTMYAVGLPPVVAVPLHAAVQMASNASRTIAYLRHVRWRAALFFCIGALPAPFLVAPMVATVNPDVIRLLMAGFIAWTLLPRRQARLSWTLPRAMTFAGVLNGGVGAVVGATGLLIGPFFLRTDWVKETTIGTLAFCQALGHCFKVAAFSAIGYGVLSQPMLLAAMVAGVVVGTAIGKRLNRLVPEARFKWLFQGVLAVLALKLGWDAMRGLLG